MSRILVITSSYTGGDFNAIAAVAVGLRDRGHDVHLLGDREVAASARRLGMPATESAPERDLRVHMARVTRAARKLDSGAGDYFLRELLDWAANVVPETVEVIRRYGAKLVLTTLGLVPVVDRAAVEASVPWGFVNGSFYIGPGEQPSLEEDFSPLIVPTMRYCCTAIEHAALAIHGTPAIFNTHGDLPANHWFVGPLGWEEPAPAPSYLDQPGYDWALVTLSSMPQNDVAIGQTAIEALAHHRVRVVLTLGPGHHADELAFIPTNTRVERLVPHSAILERSVLLVSPGGAGAVMKALQRGVPMVLVPWGMDRPGVAARAERLGVALVVQRGNHMHEELSDAINEALTDDRYREAARRIAFDLRTRDPIVNACAHIETMLARPR